MSYSWFAGASMLALLSVSSAMAGSAHHSQPDDAGPIGVMGTHLLPEGKWMAAYRYQLQSATGLRSGSRAADTHDVMHDYGEAATQMDMDMHMLEVMVGLSDRLTLMAMPQFMRMNMVHESSHGGGHRHRHETSGMGDTEVTGLYSLYDNQQKGIGQRLHLNAGLSLPTGSIDKNFTNHHHEVYHLPYNMQFGSGTYDPILGATFISDMADWSWGAQTLNYLRLGENDNGYRQGHKHTSSVWIAHNVSDMASVSLRLAAEAWGDVSGRDDSLPATTIAGADPDLQAGERLMAIMGVNLVSGDHDGPLAGHRLGAELGLPLYERYDGPQSDSDYRLTLGWHVAF